MAELITFGRRRVPSIFGILDQNLYNISYDDNIIGDERYNVTYISSDSVLVVRTCKSPLPVIAYRQLGFGRDPLNDKTILLNEDVNVYSETDIHLIKETFKAACNGQ